MNFTLIIDGIKFIAQKEEIDDMIDWVIFSYNRCNEDNTYNTQLVCDSKNVIDYVIKKILQSREDFMIYDFSKNQTPNIENFYNIIENHNPIIAKGLEEYTDYLQKNYFNNSKVSCNSKMMDEAKVKLYHDSINFRRDSSFNNYNSKVIFIFSNYECSLFNNAAYDFCSQYPETFDFNEAFKPVIEADYKNLSEYLLKINQKEFESKEYSLKLEI